MRNIAQQDNSELEALEQREWIESLQYVIQQGDRGRVQRLLDWGVDALITDRPDIAAGVVSERQTRL